MSTGVCWTSPLLKSGWNPQTLLDYARLWWTPLDSSWTKHANLALVTLTKSRS